MRAWSKSSFVFSAPLSTTLRTTAPAPSAFAFASCSVSTTSSREITGSGPGKSPRAVSCSATVAASASAVSIDGPETRTHTAAALPSRELSPMYAGSSRSIPPRLAASIGTPSGTIASEPFGFFSAFATFFRGLPEPADSIAFASAPPASSSVRSAASRSSAAARVAASVSALRASAPAAAAASLSAALSSASAASSVSFARIDTVHRVGGRAAMCRPSARTTRFMASLVWTRWRSAETRSW